MATEIVNVIKTHKAMKQSIALQDQLYAL